MSQDDNNDDNKEVPVNIVTETSSLKSDAEHDLTIMRIGIRLESQFRLNEVALITQLLTSDSVVTLEDAVKVVHDRFSDLHRIGRQMRSDSGSPEDDNPITTPIQGKADFWH